MCWRIYYQHQREKANQLCLLLTDSKKKKNDTRGAPPIFAEKVLSDRSGAYHWYDTGMWKDRFIPKGVISMQQMRENIFTSGRVVMVRSYLWYLDNLVGAPFACDIAALPSYAGINTVDWSGGIIGVFNTTEHPRKAIEVTQALTTAPEFLSLWGEVPAAAHLEPEFFNYLERQYPEVDFTAAMDGLRYLGYANLVLPNYAAGGSVLTNSEMPSCGGISILN